MISWCLCQTNTKNCACCWGFVDDREYDKFAIVFSSLSTDLTTFEADGNKGKMTRSFDTVLELNEGYNISNWPEKMLYPLFFLFRRLTWIVNT